MSDGVILCGGGLYGAMILGALEKKQFKMENIRMIAGTSAGAIIGVLMCVGYDITEIFNVMKNNLPLIKDLSLSSLFTHFGLYDPQHFLSVVENMIVEKVKYIPTFSELYKISAKELIVTGTNVSKGVSLYFNRFEYPDMSVMDAIKISTCVPLVFPCVRLDGDVCVDGALSDNLPVGFAKGYFAKHFPDETIHFHVFCLRYELKHESPTTLYSFVTRIITMIVNTMTNKNESDYYELVVDTLIPLSTENKGEIQALFDSGFNQTN